MEGVRSPQDLAARWPQFKEAAWEQEAQHRVVKKVEGGISERVLYPLPVGAFRL